jgi:hypothetical protein
MLTSVTNLAAVVFIFCFEDPSKIFIERKTDHPLRLANGRLCPIGGNWIGDGARNDLRPLDTLRREIMQELTHLRPHRNVDELVALGMATAEQFKPTPLNKEPLTSDEIAQLNLLKHVICSGLTPFGSFLNHVPKSALDAADPNNQRPGFTSLVNYFTVGLNKDQWDLLSTLQCKTGNLSNESITLITTLDEIIQRGTLTAFAHDRVLRGFFLSRGLNQAWNLPLVPGLESIPVGMPLPTYVEYMKHYQIKNLPI